MTSPATQSTVPVPLTSFVGREQEVAAVRRLLGATRLATITGAGGSGKTRLALAAAARVAGEYADGVAWVELAGLLEPELMPGHLARALGLREAGTSDPTGVLVAALRDRELLIVLDNCEHLVTACADLVATLLRGAPRLRVLATSREALGVDGERSWLIPVLSLPEPADALGPEAAARSEAVRLFVERAQDVLASFELTATNAPAVARVCRRLDGLPLAIELAAARVRVLTPEQIAARLDDDFGILVSHKRGVPARHQTLRAAVDWSYQLLPRPEQALLQRLSVFAGGFTIEAAEEVCAGDGIEASELLDLLAGLVDKSLVSMREREGAARYALLEVVRQFARERLEAEPRPGLDVHRAHGEFFLWLAEAALPHLQRTTSPAWFARLEEEHDNLRAALAWGVGHADGAVALRTAGALAWFWGVRGYWSEGAAWMDAVLAAPAGQAPGAARAHALAGAGTLALILRDAPRARALLEESVTLWARVGDSPHHVIGLTTTAHILSQLGDHEAALERATGATAIARRLAVPWLLVHALIAEATVHGARGELELAEGRCLLAEAAAEADDFTWGLADVALARARLALRRGDVPAAAAHARRAAAACARLGEPLPSLHTLFLNASVAVQTGAMDRAARLLAAVEAMRGTMRVRLLPRDEAQGEQLVDATRASLGPEHFGAAWVEGGTLGVREALALAASPNEPGAPANASPSVAAPGPPAPPVPLSDETRDAPDAASAAADGDAGRAGRAPVLEVRALGRLEIRRDGEPLPPASLQAARLREFLLYLLCHPEGRTREQIGLTFWPDLTAAEVKNNFHVALHRLRKALGRPDLIVYERDRYRVNPALDVAFDAAAFERAAREALRAGAADAVPRLRAAIDLYRGDLLEETGAGDWHLELRDRLRRLHGDAALALGRTLAAAEQYVDAADVYRRLVAREELHEEAYRRLMTCLARAGARAEAMRAYERLSALLRAELDAEPERETATLYERLRRAEPI